MYRCNICVTYCNNLTKDGCISLLTVYYTSIKIQNYTGVPTL